MKQRKQKLKKKVYFYTEGAKPDASEVMAVQLFKGDVDVAERKAERIAQKLKKKLAGGFSVGKIPYGVKKMIKVPKSTKPMPYKYNMVDEIMAYESGEMNPTQTKKLFAKLRKKGIGKSLQGHYSSRM